jgi:hypothetical protein
LDVCVTSRGCPNDGTTGGESGTKAWTEILYVDGDHNLEAYEVGMLNGIGAALTEVYVAGAGEMQTNGRYIPYFGLRLPRGVGAQVYMMNATDSDEAFALFRSHVESPDGQMDSIWVLARAGSSLQHYDAWLYTVVSGDDVPPQSGWAAFGTTALPAPSCNIAEVNGPSTCVNDVSNFIVLIDRARAIPDPPVSGPHTGGYEDYVELSGIVDADGFSVSGRFTGAKRLQLLPPGSNGRWLELDEDLQPKSCGEGPSESPETNTSTWSVGSGQCTSNGGCFFSPNYPSRYGTDQSCSITADGPGILSVEHFVTESGYDYVSVHGAYYSGHGVSHGPDGIAVSAGDTVTFRTDGSVQNTGFEICFGGAARCAGDAEPDMVSPSTLSHFIERAVANFPADHYTLELADHGGAWKGEFMDDDNNHPFGMSLAEMQGALRDGLGDTKVDVLIFNACLMAAQKVAAAMQPFADYMLASELSIYVVPTDPMNHRARVPYSATHGRVETPLEYGTAMLDSFMACGGIAHSQQSMSLTKLTAYGAFSQAMSTVAALLTTSVDLSTQNDVFITATRVVNQLFDQYELDDPCVETIYICVSMADYGIDIGVFLTQWIAALHTYSSDDARAAAAAAAAALDQYELMIMHEDHSTPLRDVYTGMTIYFPQQGSNGWSWGDDYADLDTIEGDPLDESWRSFLAAYFCGVGDRYTFDCSARSCALSNSHRNYAGSCVCDSGYELNDDNNDCVAQEPNPCNVGLTLHDAGSLGTPTGYENYADCRWTLECTDAATTPLLSFAAFETESNHDHLSVYDGSTIHGLQLMHTSGTLSTMSSTVVHGHDASMFVRLTSD